VRVNDKVPEGVKDTKHGDVNRVVRGGVYGKNEGVEAVALKLDREVFSGVLFATPFEPVFRGEARWVPNPAQRNISVVAIEDHSFH